MRKYRAKKNNKKTKTYQACQTEERENKRCPFTLCRKKVSVMNTKLWRMRISMKSGSPQNASECNTSTSLDENALFPSSSRWSEYRSVKKIKRALPSTPAKKARIVQKLMDSPQTRNVLQSSGSILSPSARKALKMSEALVASLGMALCDTKGHRGSTYNKRVAHETLYQAVMAGISRKYRMGGTNTETSSHTTPCCT